MKKNKRSFLRSLVIFVCCFSMLLPVIGTASATVAAISGNSVTASGSTTLKQGSSGYCYIYIDSLEELSSLNVEVHFDPSKVKVTGTYNSVSCTLQDSVINQDSLNYSYIFDGNGSASKTRLFYFYYTVLSDAAVGDTYFDIVITDAYDSSLNAVDVSGSRYKLSITEKTVSKSTAVSCSSSINTSVKEEFELSYRVGTNKIASGSFVINYDPELFEVISVTNGAFLDGKFTDVNADLTGSVYVSFVGTEYNNNYDLLKVKFRTLKNKATASDIKLTVTEFCDLELNNYSCTGCTTKANISHDPTYTEDAPAMTLTPTYDTSTGKVTAVIKLDKESHLGAGDFVVTFDASKLTYVSSEKGFAPSFFNINNKNAASGELKFSIISLSDITDAQTVLTIIFDAKASCTDYTTEFELNGSGLADSLTNAILLNFVESPVTVVSTGHDFSIDKHDAEYHWQKCSRCDEIDGKEAHNGGTATCTAQKVCTDCGTSYGDLLAHDYANGEWKSDASGHWKKCADCTAEDTANKVGHNATDDNNCATAVYCTDCNYMTVAAKTHTLVVGTSKNGTDHIMECTNSGCDHTEDAAHNFNQKVESTDYLKNNADCTTAKTYYYSCVCGHKGSTTFTVGSELGHNFEWVVDTPADKQNAGVKHEECTICHTKRNEGTVIDKLTCGHATATKTNQVDADHHNTGKQAYWYCAECNKYFSDEDCLLEISDINTYGIIAKVDHEFGTTWEKDANDHWHECTCGDKTDVAAHTYNQEVVNELYKKSSATCTDAAVYYKSCICGAKGNETFTSGTELGHDFEWVVDTPADKQNTGLKHEECTICHTKRNEGTVIDKLTCCHATATKTNQVDADHHNTGKKAYWYCAECNKYFSDEACLLEIADINTYGIIAKVDHEFGTTWEKDANNHWHECTCGDKTDVTAHIYNQEVVNTDYLKDGATCTTEAVYYKSCVCGAKGTETFTNGETLGHDLEHHEAKAPTCTAIGWNTYDTCKREGCGYTTYAELEALGHTEADAAVENRVEPDCITTGSYDSVVYCAVCEAELNRELKSIEVLGHDLEHHDAQAPTCTEIGWNAYNTCNRCGYTTYVEISATGHTNASAVEENRVEPTCIEDGHYDSVIYCSVCGDELSRETKIIVKLGHDLNHHDAKTPTCIEIGWNAYDTCKRDGCEHITYVELPATGHSSTAAVEENRVEANCTTAGSYDSVAYCSVCGSELSRENKTIDALGHDLEHHDVQTPTCAETGWNAYDTCKRDGCEHTTYVELEALGHDFTMDKQDADYHLQKCNRCDEIDGKAEHTYGDDNVCDTCGYEKSVQSETETSRETEKPADTDKPTDTDKPSDGEEKGGCGSSISGGMVLIFTIMICGSMIGFKRRKSH